MGEFPGIDGVKTDLVCRSITRRDSSEILVAGLMDKSGVSLDPYDWRLDKYSLCYVVRGDGFLVDEAGARHAVSAGDFYQRLPRVRHQVHVNPDSGWKECCLSVGAGMCSPFMEMGVIKTEPNVRRIGVDNDLILKVWAVKERLGNARELELPLVLLEIIGLIAEFHLFHGVMPESEKATNLINAACDYLGKNFRENRDLKAFCHANGVGYESFRKMFQKRMGMPPGRYRVRKRLETAMHMLSAQTMSIGEIAWSLGFSSQFEFCNQFKKRTGRPPSKYLS